LFLFACFFSPFLTHSLTNDLLDVAPMRSETWTAIGLYFNIKGKAGIAMSHIERV
jgi:hypothetical protein